MLVRCISPIDIEVGIGGGVGVPRESDDTNFLKPIANLETSIPVSMISPNLAHHKEPLKMRNATMKWVRNE